MKSVAAFVGTKLVIYYLTLFFIGSSTPKKTYDLSLDHIGKIHFHIILQFARPAPKKRQLAVVGTVLISYFFILQQ